MADPRFATENQIDEVEGYESAITAYQAKFDGVVKYLAGYIEALNPNSGLEIRYITGEGRDDESWRGNLLASSPDGDKVDLWCMTITMSQGLPAAELGAVGSFDKPFGIAIDYFLDWDFGTDETNSEDVFNAKINAFEYVLEQIRTCLPDACEIESWMTRRMIKRFTNASTHIAKCDLALKFSEL